MNGIERPLDLLNDCKGKDVIVELKEDERDITGILYAFDININVVIEADEKGLMFIRGDSVRTVRPKKQ